MPDQKYSPCFQCRDPENKNWEDIQTLKYALSTDRINCDLHKAAAQERIRNFREVKKYELKVPAAFLPPIPKQVFRNYQDREANNGELIE